MAPIRERTVAGRPSAHGVSRINYLALVNLDRVQTGPSLSERLTQMSRAAATMNHAVDVDELIKQVLKGRAVTSMCGPLAPPNVDYAPASATSTTRPAREALFKEAGVDPSRSSS